jgi:hypothetical protein
LSSRCQRMNPHALHEYATARSPPSSAWRVEIPSSRIQVVCPHMGHFRCSSVTSRPTPWTVKLATRRWTATDPEGPAAYLSLQDPALATGSDGTRTRDLGRVTGRVGPPRLATNSFAAAGCNVERTVLPAAIRVQIARRLLGFRAREGLALLFGPEKSHGAGCRAGRSAPRVGAGPQEAPARRPPRPLLAGGLPARSRRTSCGDRPRRPSASGPRTGPRG